MAGLPAAKELESYLHERIPVSHLMRVQVESLEAGRLSLVAPLEVNHNHLGTAFGGSLATLATLAGYGMLWTALGEREAHVVVKRSEIEYLRPVRREIRAVCELPEERVCEGFRRTFRSKGKARVKLMVLIHDMGELCVRFRGEFVAVR